MALWMQMVNTSTLATDTAQHNSFQLSFSTSARASAILRFRLLLLFYSLYALGLACIHESVSIWRAYLDSDILSIVQCITIPGVSTICLDSSF